MAEKRVITFTSIAEFFKDNCKQLQRGENSYASGNVSRVTFDAEVRPALLKGEVEASMKNRKYSVELSIDTEDGIVMAKCTCPRGQLICHHMAAVCIFGHHNVSVTDQACAWNVPRHTAEDVSKTIECLYPSKRADYVAVGRRATQQEVQQFMANLTDPIGFTWLLKPEPTVVAVQLIPAIEDVVFCNEYLQAVDKQHYVQVKCAVTSEQIIMIVNATKGQYRNPNWLICRKHRLTASHFGMVLAACGRNRFPPSLFRSLFEAYNLDTVTAIHWGRTHEEVARTTFAAAMGVEVETTGFWLEPCGFLGASPDGLVGNDAILEIKCPYKYRNSSLEEALKNDQTYIIRKTVDGATEINKTHPYWHQMQGQLHITNRNKCYLVVWTPQECEICPIERDVEWANNINVLKTFYMEHCLKFLLEASA